MTRTIPIIAWILPFCISCSDTPSSLVGADELPNDRTLATEAFYIMRGGGPNGGNSLIYDWRVDGTLIIEHKFSDGRGWGETRGRETLRVSDEAAAQARRLLARVRPARLEGVEQDARPLGCQQQGSHDVGEITIGFIRPGDNPGIEDDEVGLFALPYTSSCDTQRQARLER